MFFLRCLKLSENDHFDSRNLKLVIYDGIKDVFGGEIGPILVIVFLYIYFRADKF